MSHQGRDILVIPEQVIEKNLSKKKKSNREEKGKNYSKLRY